MRIKLVESAVDYGDTLEMHVTGYFSVARISPGIIEEVYYETRELPDGEIERRVKLRLLWDATEWFEARRITAVLDVPYTAAPKPEKVSDEASIH
jgi:hypothetical protein